MERYVGKAGRVAAMPSAAAGMKNRAAENQVRVRCGARTNRANRKTAKPAEEPAEMTNEFQHAG